MSAVEQMIFGRHRRPLIGTYPAATPSAEATEAMHSSRKRREIREAALADIERQAGDLTATITEFAQQLRGVEG